MLRSFPSFPLNPCFLYLLGGPNHPYRSSKTPSPPFPIFALPVKGALSSQSPSFLLGRLRPLWEPASDVLYFILAEPKASSIEDEMIAF